MGFRNLMGPHKLIGGIREKACDFLLFGVARHPNHKLTKVVVGHSPRQGRQGINGNAGRFKLRNFRLDHLQVIFQSR